MFIPLHDANPLRHLKTPYVTRSLIAVTVLIYVIFQSGLVFGVGEEVAAIGFGVIPIELLHPTGLRGPLTVVPEPLTLVTYVFLHGNWMHLGGNMLFLWVFGDNIEDAMGHARFLAFYLLCGIVAGLFHTVALPDSNMMLIGASGSVAGIISAYVILHPRVKLWVLVLMRIPLRVRAMWAIGAWIVYQVVAVWMGIQDQTSWWGHLGGLVAGAVLLPFFRRPGVPLFDRGLE
jgi:membrane associated rhomboid family serine protease